MGSREIRFAAVCCLLGVAAKIGNRIARECRRRAAVPRFRSRRPPEFRRRILSSVPSDRSADVFPAAREDREKSHAAVRRVGGREGRADPAELVQGVSVRLFHAHHSIRGSSA